MMAQTKRLPAVGVLLGAALLSTGCAGGSSDLSSLPIDLNEWQVIPNRTSVQAGKVKITAKNRGSVEHEVVVLKTDLAPGALLTRGDKVDEDRAGDNIGEIEEDELQPGKTMSRTFNLPAGKYALVCNVGGHYASGMYAPLTVVG